MEKSLLRTKWNNYKRSKRWWSILLDFLFLVLIVAMLIPGTRRSLSAFLVRQTLLSPRESSKTILLDDSDWAFRISNYNGEISTLSELKGKPVFINYWATWCPPCIAEMPSIQNLYNKYKDKVHFVFISNESPDVVNAFMERKDYSLPLYRHSGVIPDAFESSVLPSTFIISPAGRLVLFKTGAAKWDSKKMFKLLDKLIQE
jgi:thiol-disulfide isomerase/thioredoxin